MLILDKLGTILGFFVIVYSVVNVYYKVVIYR